jgi:phosphatidylglycerophosphate synthase
MNNLGARLRQHGEPIGIVATIARLPMAHTIAKNIRNSKSVAGPLALFVGADIADGWVARQLEADSPRRRALDAIIDRSSVLFASAEMWRHNRSARPFFGNASWSRNSSKRSKCVSSS